MEELSNETLMYWSKQLQDLHPNLPPAVIEQALRQFRDYPNIFNEVCEQHKQTPFEPIKRETKAIYDTTESGNDLPWGKEVSEVSVE